MSRKPTHIGLWLDQIGDPENPAWIVSFDRRYPWGEVATSATEFALDDYADALAEAQSLAQERGLPLIRTNEYGTTKTLYEPPPETAEGTL